MDLALMFPLRLNLSLAALDVRLVVPFIQRANCVEAVLLSILAEFGERVGRIHRRNFVDVTTCASNHVVPW